MSGAASAGTAPRLSVVVPTFNRVGQLAKVIDALMVQTLPADAYEVIVVVDGSTDGTVPYLASRTEPNLVVEVQENAGPAAARNHGVDLARGEVVLFVDDDVVAAPDLVECHLESHVGQDDSLVVFGPMLTPADAELSPWVAWEQAMLEKQYRAMRDGRFRPTFRQFYTGNASVPRCRLVAAGGFDTRLRRAEDVELAYRLHQAGMGFAFNQDAKGFHYAERSFESWLRIASDYGRTDGGYVREGGELVAELLAHEFGRRHRLVRWSVRLCNALPRLEPALRSALRTGAIVTNRLGFTKATQQLLSGLYNVVYYRAVAEELGGDAAFRTSVLSGRHSA